MRPGRRQEQQKSMWLLYDQLPQSQGHVVCKRLQKLLYKEGVDSFSEKLCAPFYAEKKRPQVHSTGFNLGVLLRALFGFGTAKGWAAAGAGLIFARIGQLNLLILVI